MKTSTYAAPLAALAMFAWGCDDAKPTQNNTPAETNGATSEAPAAGTTNAKKDAPGAATNAAATNSAKKIDPKDIPTDPEHMESDPSATDTLELIDLKGKAPEGFEVKGKLLHVYGWTDKYGTHVFSISRYETASKSGSSMMMIGHVAYREGDGSWSDTRIFKEQVSDCQFDITLEPQVGDWVVTDVDKDGLGEVTFAYHTGCRSDVSPVGHKVLISTADGKKFALRGDSAVAADGKNYEGGTFKTDADFQKAPKALQVHAEKVWKDTVREKM